MINSELSILGWRKAVINQLILGASHFYIVEDPDQLMAEAGIQRILAARNLVFYAFDDSIALRHFYESRIRLNIDKAETLVISIDTEKINARDLPFDIIHQAKVISLSLAECIPELFRDVLDALEPEELDTLHAAVSEFTPGKLGDIASRDFVLRHVYHVAPEVIQSSSDLLRTLLRLHYRDIDLPDLLKGRLSELISKRSQFKAWPIKDILSSKTKFFSFLQLHWRAYVEAVRISVHAGVKEPVAVYESFDSGKAKIVLPFGHDDVRVYIDNLFLEGVLRPIEIQNPEQLANHWCLVGISIDVEKQNIRRINGLIKLCTETLPPIDARHQTWYQFASRWAELCAVYHTQVSIVDEIKFIELRQQVDIRFTAWMQENYQSLHNHPPIPPAMLHHIPRSMERDVCASTEGKSALILIDGLAQDQWVTLRNNLTLDYPILESSVFAWVPTVTSVSRQALFTGKAPYQFSKSIYTTSTEPKAWQNYWIERGLDRTTISYDKGLGRDDVVGLIDRLSDHRLRIVGLVINTIDDIMHGMLLGSAGMHNQIALWAKSGYLSKLINGLVKLGFTVHLTADHGNVEAKGVGKVDEGAIAESRGERTRVYKTDNLRTETYKVIAESTNNAINWPQIGLPSDFWPIVMSGREAFVARNEIIVGHGGISIEEVIVPYIKIMSSKNE
ncbi:MAG: BREX-3 system phosphatase PglZ [Candidatus Saccharibacteria bacterium]|nr:BREX-3 system phosphatase PglZ [Moraxellaceae bacterium]